jgi:probable F420-dependent oxidoreductase
MKLGIHLPLEFFTSNQAVEATKLIEAAGLDHVLVNDHLCLPRGPYVIEAWTLLAAIGAVTEHIRLGPCVTPLPLRQPYLLAKMGATVDQLSKGRLLMGVGGGWHREEFEWLGSPFLPHSKRLAQTEEAIELIQSYWSKPRTTFHGDYYRVQDVALEPKPVQHPYPPFFLGGGSMKVLELTATYGQGWMPFAPTSAGLTRRIQQLDELLSEHGRVRNEVKIIPSIILQFGKSQKDAQKRLPKWGNPTAADRAILGSPVECLTRIHEYAEAGATHLALRLVHPTEISQSINIIQEQILPHL